MEYPKFDSLNGNSNMFHYLENRFDMTKLYQLLPVIQMPKGYQRPKDKKKNKVGPMGTIFSIRSKQGYRGLFGKLFPNGIILDLNIGSRAINMKIYRDKIQTLGCPKKEALEAVGILFYNCKLIDNMLERISKDEKTLQWVLSESTQGDELKVPQGYPDHFPPDVDALLATYLINFMADFRPDQVEEYQVRLQKLYDENQRYTDVPPKLRNSFYAMTKYSYSLGRKIDCFMLYKLLQGHDMITFYEPVYDINIMSLEIPCDPPDDLKKEIHRKSKKSKKSKKFKKSKINHTIEIKSNGNFAQTSPHPQLAAEAFQILMELIRELGDTIFLPF